MTRKSLWNRCFIRPRRVFGPLPQREPLERRYVAELLPVNNNVGGPHLDPAGIGQFAPVIGLPYCQNEVLLRSRRGTDDAKCPDSSADRLCAPSGLAADAHGAAALCDRGDGVLFRDHYRLLRWLHSAQLQFGDGDWEVPRPDGR